MPEPIPNSKELDALRLEAARLAEEARTMAQRQDPLVKRMKALQRDVEDHQAALAKAHRDLTA
jgi:hypothetical protein